MECHWQSCWAAASSLGRDTQETDTLQRQHNPDAQQITSCCWLVRSCKRQMQRQRSKLKEIQDAMSTSWRRRNATSTFETERYRLKDTGCNVNKLEETECNVNVPTWKRQNTVSTFEAGTYRMQCQHSKLEEIECNVQRSKLEETECNVSVWNWKRQSAMSAFKTGRDRMQCQRSTPEETYSSVKRAMLQNRPQGVKWTTSQQEQTDHQLPPLDGSQNSDTSPASGHWPLYISLSTSFSPFLPFYTRCIPHDVQFVRLQKVWWLHFDLTSPSLSVPHPCASSLFVSLSALPPPPSCHSLHTISPLPPPPPHPCLSAISPSLSFFFLPFSLHSFSPSLYLTLFSFIASPSFYTIPQSSSLPSSCLSSLPPQSRHSLSHSLVIQLPPLSPILFCVLLSPISLPPSTSTFLSI